MKARAQEPLFVVQEHRSSHLHYDLRLEHEGALKSWAVPKGIPLDAGIRRLAVMAQDHARAYADFEGDIPEGDYGAGTVTQWDKGVYTPVKFEQDEIIFDCQGRRMQGVYCLIKLKSKNGRDKNWLLFKKKTVAS